MGERAMRYLDETRPWVDALYLAVLPDARAAMRMAVVGEAVRRRHGLRARACAPARMHISLLGLPYDPEAPEASIRRARDIGAAVARPDFEVAFTTARNFGGGAMVFCCSPGAQAALTGLRDQLKGASEALGGRHHTPFAPHLTFAYAQAPMPDTILDGPIRWPAREVVLIHSEQGRGRHNHLARWRLGETAGQACGA